MYDAVYRSPNFGYPKGSAGRRGHEITAIGLHISGGSWSSNYNWIMNPESKASYNAIVLDDGQIYSLVAEDNTAYSHGKVRKSTWALLKPDVNPNLYTLSLARTGTDQRKWATAQLDATVKLLRYWCDKYRIKPVRPYIFGHSEIDSVRRWFCPGHNFFETVILELEKDAPRADGRDLVIYTVVAGSFRHRSNADNRVMLLARMGVKSFVTKEVNRHNQVVHRVIAGSYTSAKHARLNSARLQRMGIDSFIVTYTGEPLTT